jgi:hypothetical protein
VIAAAAAVALLALVGGLPAWRLCGRWIEAAVLSPSVGALVLTPGAVVAVTTDLSPVLCAVVGIATANLFAWRWGGRLTRWRPTSPPAAVAIVVLVCAVVAAVYLSRPPVEWDAHSIWLFRSDWFATGGGQARAIVELGRFAHPDYPPLLPASAGTASRLVSGDLEWRPAQASIAAVSWSLLASALLVVLDGARHIAVGVIGGVLTVVAVTAALGLGVASGEADLAAAGAAALVAVTLVVRREPELLTLGLVAASIAVLVKGESLATTMVVLAVAAVVRRPPRWVLLLPVAVAGAWLLTARSLGAGSTFFGGDRSLATAPARAWISFGNILSELGTVGAAALLASGLAAAAQPAARGRLTSIWLVVAGSTFGLVAVYAVGDLPLEQWLDDSVRRVSTGPLVVASIAAVIAVDEALALLGHRPHAGRQARLAARPDEARPGP